MLNQSKIDELIEILKKDLKRAKRMQAPGFPKVYYASFLLRDEKLPSVIATGGSLVRSRCDHLRNILCDIRVGSYKYDQTMEGGLRDNDEEAESVGYTTVPVDDSCHDGLRVQLWRLSDAKFREALSDWNQKKSRRITSLDANRNIDSCVKSRRVQQPKYKRLEKIDLKKWERFCKSASHWMLRLPKISTSWVEFEGAQVTKIFVNTEGSVIVQNEQVFSLIAAFNHLTPEGLHLEQELVLNCGSQKELPTLAEFKRQALLKYDQLMEIAGARKIHSFSGPVLLYPMPAGVLFHEAVGHRLEGNRLLCSYEGQTFKGQKGRRVLNLPVTIKDNPKIKKFKGKHCIGSYDFDDEGVEAQNALLIEDGILKDFLSSRAAIRKGEFKSNGHARSRRFQRAISRMGVTVVESPRGHGLKDLKQLLVAEIRRQKKPFGMIVYETSGGETETTSYDFQAFSGEISYATLVYPDGSEECIRGVNFVGTPLQALNNVIAVGKDQELNNSYCGAESGFLPVSTISPAVLLRNLELQSREEILVTQYILPKPKL